MFRIALVDVPFARFVSPSLALAQLKAVVERELGDAVRVTICHAHVAFAQRYGPWRYHTITQNTARRVGFGDWVFRRLAFPELEDNLLEYATYLAGEDCTPEHLQGTTRFCEEHRQPVEGLLEEMLELYHLDDQDLVGFTALGPQTMAAIAMARRVKVRLSEALTVMGGLNCFTPMGEVLARQVAVIDFVFSGPSLQTFPEFVRLAMRGDRESCHNLPGVFSRRNLSVTGQRPPGEVGPEIDIDEVPEPDFDEFMKIVDQSRGTATIGTILPFQTSRGCGWGQKTPCRFCGMTPRSLRYMPMSPQKATRQIESVLRYFPRVKRFFAADSMLPRSYLSSVFPKLRLPEGIVLVYEARADLTDAELRAMRSAGIKYLEAGIEALATDALRLMGKGTTSCGNIAFLRSCAEIGLTPGWNLLIGSVGETEATIERYRRILPRLVHLPPPTAVSRIEYMRYSEYHRFQERYGLRLVPARRYKLIFPFPDDEMAGYAYHFRDTQTPEQIVEERLERVRPHVEYWKRRWFGKEGSPAKLELRNSTALPTVLDTRAGEPLVHHLSDLQGRILDLLRKPRGSSPLADELGVPTGTVRAELDCLEERGLVVDDSEQYLSLVVNQYAPLVRDSAYHDPACEAGGTDAMGGSSPPAHSAMVAGHQEQA